MELSAEWINLAAIVAVGILLWRVLGHRLNAIDKRLEKTEDAIAAANEKLTHMTGELRGKRSAELDKQVADIIQKIGSGSAE